MDPFTILAIVSAVSAGTSVYAQTEAGKAQSRSLKEQAKQEEQERAAGEARVALLREPIEVSIENLNETSFV